MIELTEQQRQAVAEAPEAPALVRDPVTGITYVLLRSDLYEQLTGSFGDDGPTMQEVASLVARNMREDDRNDPLLEGYQQG